MRKHHVTSCFPLCLSLILICCSSLRPLRVVQATAPNYPLIARMAHIEGDMVIAVDVAPDGRALDATIVSGPPLLKQDSLAAAREWIFANDLKQLRQQRLTFTFKIAGAPNKEGQDVKFLPPDRLVVTGHPVQTEDPDASPAHPKRR